MSMIELLRYYVLTMLTMLAIGGIPVGLLILIHHRNETRRRLYRKHASLQSYLRSCLN